MENISQHEEMVESIKGIAAFARNEQGEELILFQNFSRSHVIQPTLGRLPRPRAQAGVERVNQCTLSLV